MSASFCWTGSPVGKREENQLKKRTTPDPPTSRDGPGINRFPKLMLEDTFKKDNNNSTFSEASNMKMLVSSTIIYAVGVVEFQKS